MGRKTGKPALTVSPGKAVNDAPLPCPARETRLQLRHRITSSELKARRNTWGHICPPNTRLWQKEGSLRGRSCNWPTGKTGPGRAGPGAPRPDSACLLALAPSPPPNCHRSELSLHFSPAPPSPPHKVLQLTLAGVKKTPQPLHVT